MALLASFLHVLPHEFLTVLLEHLVDLVQDGVDVLGHLLVALGDLAVDRGLDLVGLLARAGGPLLPAGVPGGHAALRCSVARPRRPVLLGTYPRVPTSTDHPHGAVEKAVSRR